MYKNRNKFLIGTSIIFLMSNIVQAAEKIELNSMNSVLYNYNFNILKQLDNADNTFKPVKEVKLGQKTRLKLVQFYKEIPVIDTYLVSSSDSLLKSDEILGKFYNNIENDINSVTPSITNLRAINLAKKQAKNKNKDIKNIENINSTLAIKIYKDTAKLIYVVDFLINDGNSGPSRPFTIIDAHTGEILEHWEGLTSEAYTTAGTGPGGNSKSGKYVYGIDYAKLIVEEKDSKCYMDSPNVATYDLKHATSGGSIHSFDCYENSYKLINGAYSPINDAHYFGNVVYDMYKSWYDAAPLTFKLKLKVHYGTSHENAYWTGSEMLFGDGASRFYPFVSLDIVGHEVSHGFTQQNSDLAYQNQSGGMNESFSDIAGEAAEYFMNLNKPEDQRTDWLVGESVLKGAAGSALRYFADPTKDGYSIAHTRNYDPNNNEVHSTSGIFNKAFYTLAVTNGWGLKKAFDAFVLANQLYWTQNSTFDEGGCGVKHAATDLGYNVNDVISAFEVVGVNATCGTTDPDPDPNPNPDPKDAIKLENVVPYYGVTAKAGETKMFYFDIPSGTYSMISLWNYGGYGDVSVMRMARDRIPTGTDFDCSTNDSFYKRYCYMYYPKPGRYFIKLDTDSGYKDVTMWVYFG